MSFIIINIIIHVALPLHFFSLFKSCCNLFGKLQKNVCTCSLVYSYVCNILICNKYKNIFNKNERRCRDVKTQKAGKQGWEANIGPKIKQTTSI